MPLIKMRNSLREREQVHLWTHQGSDALQRWPSGHWNIGRTVRLLCKLRVTLLEMIRTLWAWRREERGIQTDTWSKPHTGRKNWQNIYPTKDMCLDSRVYQVYIFKVCLVLNYSHRSR